MEDIKKSLTVLNNALLTKTFLVGERVTLADISVACNLLMLYKQVSYSTLNYGFIKCNFPLNDSIVTVTLTCGLLSGDGAQLQSSIW